MNGWFKCWRKMWDHPVWSLSPGQRCVWLTCLEQANITSKWWDSGRVEIPPGGFITSQDHLAKLAGVSRIVVRRALENLERIGSIRAKVRANRWTLIEVVNWPTYQGADDEVSPEMSPPRAHREPTESHDGRRKEGKNIRTPYSPPQGDGVLAGAASEGQWERPSESDGRGSDGPRSKAGGHADTGPRSGRAAPRAEAAPAGFDAFWSAYPRKVAKQAALKAWGKLAPADGLLDRIMQALAVQKKCDQWRREGGAYVPYPASWLNGRRWEDEVPGHPGNGREETKGPVDVCGRPLPDISLKAKQDG